MCKIHETVGCKKSSNIVEAFLDFLIIEFFLQKLTNCKKIILPRVSWLKVIMKTFIFRQNIIYFHSNN